MSMPGDDTSVRVATRIRPQLAREKIDMCRSCTFVTPGEPQVTMGQDRAFTYDYLFDMDSTQEAVYNNCVYELIEGCLEGYNATVFAYGQTGSGKTYTMGTGFDVTISEDEKGIIPRAITHLFNGIEKRRQTALESDVTPPDFKVHAQFMELYQEEIIDLLDANRDPDIRHKKSHIKIHEDAHGGIYTVGIATKLVSSIHETIQCLQSGALSRTTASTNMNAQSSRSHAVFTLHIKQQRLVTNSAENEDIEMQTNGEGMPDFETLTAKFHFVDLAGSERLKRTGATGDRAKEGISINCGLLALGNVISALGDKTKKASHVPYRDSKLTRLLQDSLGGNSCTLMIACVSPTDRDFMETLNTLKYANRARNIKNKVSINQDKSSRQISALRAKVQELEIELNEYRQGKRLINEEGVEEINDLFHENTMLQTENNNLRSRVKALQETIDGQTARLSVVLAEQVRQTLSAADGDNSQLTSLIEEYIKEIEQLRAKVIGIEFENARLRSRSRSSQGESRLFWSPSHPPLASQGDFSKSLDFSESPDQTRVQTILDEAKKEVAQMKDIESGRMSRLTNQGSDKENEPEDYEEDGDITDESDENSDSNGSSSSSEDSDSEDKEDAQLHEDLAELSCEINIKQKLIDELELSQKKIQTMKTQYEEKMMLLQKKIKDTQSERDLVLLNLGDLESHSMDKATKIKEEYEKKLRKMQDNLKKLNIAQKEHAKLLKSKSQYERQMKTLSHELVEMKKSKTRLMKQIREEQQQSRAKDIRRSKEVMQLKKEYRKKESQLKTLEAEKRQKELILKRKQEEVASLRRLQKPMSDKVAGRVTKRIGPEKKNYTNPKLPLSAATRKRHQRKGTSDYSTKVARHKWQSVEKKVQEIVIRRQTVMCMEDDMERFMQNRKMLCKDRDKLLRKCNVAESMGQENLVRDLSEQIDSISANIDYVQESIQECQANLVEITETKDDGENEEMNAVMSSCTLTEARYLMEHFVNLSIEKGLYAVQRDGYCKELEAKTHQMEQQILLQQQLLQHVLTDADQLDLEVQEILSNPMAEQSSSSSAESSAGPSPVDNSGESNVINAHATFLNVNVSDMLQPPSTYQQFQRNRDKARRRTATCQDLLYAASGQDIPSGFSQPVHLHEVSEVNQLNESEISQVPDHQLMPPPPPPLPLPHRTQLQNILPAKTDSDNASSFHNSEEEKCKSSDTEDQDLVRSRRGSFTVTRSSSLENLMTPPGSPPSRRRFIDEKNVFSRLSQTNSPSVIYADRGCITPCTGKQNTSKSPLICSHTAEGHTKAVLTVEATEHLLFSGSKDRTVKVWNLETGQEIISLVGHPNNVISVKYSERLGLLFSVSTSYVKVWDIRDSQAPCIKTLSSSGHTLGGGVALTGSRTLAVPAGEISINAITVNQSGTTLYSAAGSTVRFWDLRSFQAMGKLVGGHSAAVMALAVERGNHDMDVVITGSKDHYIKVFEVPEEAGGVVSAKAKLEPPHYDGIQSLAVSGTVLFSGSRDMCIKKWNLNSQTPVKSINSAHKDWVCALQLLPERDYLLSGCRGGLVKLWSVTDCHSMGEIKAHTSPINAIASNSNVIFTASSDRTISIWRLNANLESTDRRDNQHPVAQ